MEKQLNAVFCCKESNDLISALRQSGYAPSIFSDTRQAISQAAAGTAVFLLADCYPTAGTVLNTDLLEAARTKALRLYVEYPEVLPNQTSAEPHATVYERLVAAQDFGALRTGDIFVLNGCHYHAFTTQEPAIISICKLAGYDRSVFGLPEDTITGLAFWDDRKDVLVAASYLSGFIKGRYAPSTAWKKLWQAILELMGCGQIDLQWKKTVNLTADRTSPLPADALREAWQRNIAWTKNHMVTTKNGKVEVFEGYSSAITHEGNQPLQQTIRADCMGEIAMALCCGWKQNGDAQSKQYALDIVNRLLTEPAFYHNDPTSSMYGLVNWFENGDIFYGDDNARMLLGILCVRELTGDNRWDEQILRCVLANLRTSGINGLRRPRLQLDSFVDSHWSQYYDEAYPSVAPHYQAYLWAVFLWMYALTGIEELLTKSERALALAMEKFPDKLNWQNSLSGEVTRLLLPLSFLQRVAPSEQHAQWLRRVVDATIEHQADCGAIRDFYGALELGHYPPPQSNEAYGTTEAPLIQNNGDPATDLLYTTNWAFIGLWEASLVLPDQDVQDAMAKLRDFLLRIQVRSEAHPNLDGTWLRSFDYEKWEYWGSSADVGWAAWCVESGWTNAWLASILILQERGESLLQLSSKDAFSAIAPALYEDMMTRRPTRDVLEKPTAKMAGSAE